MSAAGKLLRACGQTGRLTAHLVVTFSCVGVVLCGVALFGAGGHDDSHVTYWSAHSLAEFGKIVNYNGDAIEPSSSVGFVALLALLSLVIPLPIPTIGWVAGIVFSVLAVIAAVRFAHRLGCPRPEVVAPLIASTMSFAYWATSGMETSMSAFAAVVVVDAIRGLMYRADARSIASTAAVAVFFVACRPENAIILPCIGCAAVVLSLLPRSRPPSGSTPLRPSMVAAIVGGLTLAVPSVFFALRWLAFKRLFPNPVGVKSGDSVGGFFYFFDSLAENNPLLLPLLLLVAWTALRGLIRRDEPSVGRELAAAYVFAATSFVVAVGGDWMTGGRFVVAIIPIAWVLIVHIAEQFVSTKRVVLGFVAVMVCANLTMTVQFARNDDRNRGRPGLIGWATGEKFQGIVADIALPELINKSHLRDAMMIGELSRVVDRLLEDRDDPVWIMSDLAGMVPYHVFTEHFGRVGFIDWYSITTRTPLSNCLPKYRVHRDLLGTYAQLEYYLDGKLAECGVPVPDLFFSAYSSERDMRDYRYRLDRMGFSVLHMQTGRITSPRSGRILSSTTPLYALIAVRKDLIPRVSDEVRGP